MLVLLLFLPQIVRGPLPQHVMIISLLYALLGQAWNIVGGYAGQISLGQSLFFGVGAYTSTALLLWYHVSPWFGMVAGALLAALAALLIGMVLFRLGGHYFAIATLALPVIAQSILVSWNLAEGSSGLRLPYVGGDSWAQLVFVGKLPFFYIMLTAVCLVYVVTHVVENSRLGFYLRAIRNDEVASQGVGVHVSQAKVVALVLSAFFTALGGTLYAQYVRFIDPDSVFELFVSVQIMLVVVLGGVGTFWGPLVGAAILIPLAQGAKSLLGSRGLGIDAILYAALIVVVAVVQPGGLLGARRWQKRWR